MKKKPAKQININGFKTLIFFVIYVIMFKNLNHFIKFFPQPFNNSFF